MCGFYGSISAEFNYSESFLKDISNSINHRGPDAHNFIKDFVGKNHIYLDHCRLSIIDLSKNGTQPFVSEDKNFILVFNGEIYNFYEIREKLEKKNIKFKTKTDTEVLLQAWIMWGKDCLNQFSGMFAFSILDKRKQKIFLVRDNFGMKPLYYYKDKNNLFFASEIICILKILKRKVTVNTNKSYDYLIYGNHDDNHETFFSEIFQLRPGELLSMDLATNFIEKQKWWNPKTNLIDNISFETAKNNIKKTFLESVKKHLISDVEIGVALSGGVDSSAIACAIKNLYPEKKINLLSFIPEHEKDNEIYWIEKVEKYLGEKSLKISQSNINLIQTIDELIELQGEPFSDTTILAEYLIFKEAKKKGIKVLLMGHGGDEVFVGYDGFPGAIIKTYFKNNQFISLLKFCFHWKNRTKQSYFSLIKKISKEIFDYKIRDYLLNLIGFKKKPDWISSNYLKNNSVSLGSKFEKINFVNNRNLANKQLENIFFNSLPAMLRYADRSSMKNSIECRLPFLNEDLINQCLSFPENFLVSKEGNTKYIFKESMKNIVPKDIINRKDKIGYLNNNDKLINTMIENTDIDPEIGLFNKFKLKEFLYKKNHNKYVVLQKWRIINFLRWRNIFKQYLSY